MQHYFDNFDLSSGWAQLASFIAVIGSMFGYLPLIGAGVACIYYCIQIWESATVKRQVKMWQATRTAARIAALQRKQRQLSTELKRLGHTQD